MHTRNATTDQLSPKSDIWSFGLSLWALATGQFPYEDAIQDEFDLRMASECSLLLRFNRNRGWRQRCSPL